MRRLIERAIAAALQKRDYVALREYSVLALRLEAIETGQRNRYGIPDRPDWRARYREAIARQGFADDVDEAVQRPRICGS